MDSLIGTTLGGYTLIRAIGSGGMGAVYLAEDQSVGQQVAIKIVRTEDDDFADMFSKEEAIERFKKEARAIATLDHLHILPLFRYGEEKVSDSLRAYMVMQYRPEGSLWDWLRKRAGQALGEQSQISNAGTTASLPAGLPTNWPLSVTEAADYLQQASSALQYAHDHDIIHRDVKPANFLLRFDKNNTTNATNAFLLLSDFGLAKFFSTSSATSHALGTPMYMAPEQFHSSAGPETDQYALAVMIYYMLAGRPPFMGDPAKMMYEHLSVEPPPIRTLVPDLSAGIEAVLNRALAKQKHDRYPGIEAFAEDFFQRINNTTQGTRAQFAPPRPLTLASTTATTTPPSPPPAEILPTIVQPQITPYSGSQSSTPAALDATKIAPPPPPISLPPTAFMPSPSNSTPLAQPAHPTMQNWEQVATIQQIGQETKPAQNTNKDNVSRRRAVGWIIGGVAAVGIGVVGGGIYLYENQQGQQQTTQGGATARYTLIGHTDEVRCISWSPAGDYLASGSLDTSVRVWNIQTQQTMTYSGHTQGVEAVAWSQSAQSQLITSGGIDDSVRVWNSSTGQDKISYPNLGNEVSSLTWTANDLSIFVGTLGAGLHEIFVNRTQATQLGVRDVIDTIALSPDGLYLAMGLRSGVVTISSVLDRKLIYTKNHTNSIFGLAWSSDSNRLAIGGSDQRVDILNITTRSIIKSNTRRSTVNGLSWEPGNTGRLAIAQADGKVSVWNTTNDTLITGTGHTGAVTAVAWGNGYLASASTDKTIIVWNV